MLKEFLKKILSSTCPPTICALAEYYTVSNMLEFTNDKHAIFYMMDMYICV